MLVLNKTTCVRSNCPVALSSLFRPLTPMTNVKAFHCSGCGSCLLYHLPFVVQGLNSPCSILPYPLRPQTLYFQDAKLCLPRLTLSVCLPHRLLAIPSRCPRLHTQLAQGTSLISTFRISEPRLQACSIFSHTT